MGSFISGIVNDQQGITWLLCKTVVVPLRIHSQKLFGCRLEVGLPLGGCKEVETLLVLYQRLPVSSVELDFSVSSQQSPEFGSMYVLNVLTK